MRAPRIGTAIRVSAESRALVWGNSVPTKTLRRFLGLGPVIALVMLCVSTVTSAQPISIVRRSGSSLACGLDAQGRTSLLRSTHAGFSALPLAKTLTNKKRQLSKVKDQLLEQERRLKKRSGRVQTLRAKIRKLRLRRNGLRAEISFIIKCQRKQLRFDPPNTPVPSPTPTPEPENGFVNFESMQVRPMVLSPDRTKLYAVNTPDARLEVFELSGATVIHRHSIFVGYDPVSVRLQDDATAWVVNRISRTVAIVDLQAHRVTRLLRTGDQPSDVVFAGGKAFVTNTTENRIQVFNLANLDAAPEAISIRGMRPFSLDVTPSGRVVGLTQITTDTALVSRWIVNVPNGPYQGLNPIPNDGQGFSPPMNPSLPSPPETGLIVKRGTGDRMFDGNGVEWTGASLILPEDNDVFVIDPRNLAIQYHQLDFSNASALAVRPDGEVSIVGTRALNEKRFEPNLKGNFARIEHAILNLSTGGETVRSLNPHLSFSSDQIEVQGDPTRSSATLRARSIANPSGVAWSPDGARGYITGQGSDNVIQVDATGARIPGVAPLTVGGGPSGVVLEPGSQRLFAYNGHSNTISVVDLAQWRVVGTVAFHDPTPGVIRQGRPLLYNAHKTSGMGTFSCATCHINGDTDSLLWDLGDPTGEMVTITQNCLVPADQGGCQHHPMKGPFLTQTLQEIIGTGPLHWRGDKNDLTEFNGAFTGLLGSPQELTSREMSLFERYVDTIRVPPSPHRGVDNSLKRDVQGGDAVRGQQIFMASCNTCHQAANGGKGGIVGDMSGERGDPSNLFIDGPGIVPRTDTLRERLAVETLVESPTTRSVVPVGFLHDGSTSKAGLFSGFLGGAIGAGAGLTGEQLGATPEHAQAIQDLIAFVKSFPVRTPAGIGTSLVVNLPHLSQSDAQTLGEMLVATESGSMKLIAKLRRSSTMREEGFIVQSDTVVSDRAGVAFTYAQFVSEYVGSQVLLMLVPSKAAARMGIDRDGDGVLDGDE